MGTGSDHMIGDYSERADDCVFRFLADPPVFTTARGASLALSVWPDSLNSAAGTGKRAENKLSDSAICPMLFTSSATLQLLL